MGTFLNSENNQNRQELSIAPSRFPKNEEIEPKILPLAEKIFLNRSWGFHNQSDGHDVIMNPATEVAGWLLKLPKPKS